MTRVKNRGMDLTSGSIIRNILVFSLPIFLGQVFQNLYNSVDAIVVGNAVGTQALAAVTSSNDISLMMVGFFSGFSTGAGVLLSRFYGEKNEKKLHEALHTSILFALIIGGVMALFGFLLTPFLLWLVKCPQDVYADSSAYLRIYMFGILFTSIYNVGAGVLRAIGDSRRPFYYLVISSVMNILLDILLVAVFRWGVVGAAVATVISQFASVVLVAWQLLRNDGPGKLVISELKIQKEYLVEVIRLGIPAGIQSALIGISNLFVQRYVNSFGSAAMAGVGAAKKIDKFIGMVGMSIGLAISTYVSQNLGARKRDRVFKGIRACILICLVYCLVVGSFLYLFAERIVGIFSADPQAIVYGVAMIHTMVPLYFAQSLNQIFANAVRGFGKSFVVMICSIMGMIVCRQIFLAITFAIRPDIRNVYLGFPLGWIFAALFVFIYYMVVIRRRIYLEEKKGIPSGF